MFSYLTCRSDYSVCKLTTDLSQTKNSLVKDLLLLLTYHHKIVVLVWQPSLVYPDLRSATVRLPAKPD